MVVVFFYTLYSFLNRPTCFWASIVALSIIIIMKQAKKAPRVDSQGKPLKKDLSAYEWFDNIFTAVKYTIITHFFMLVVSYYMLRVIGWTFNQPLPFGLS